MFKESTPLLNLNAKRGGAMHHPHHNAGGSNSTPSPPPKIASVHDLNLDDSDGGGGGGPTRRRNHNGPTSSLLQYQQHHQQQHTSTTAATSSTTHNHNHNNSTIHTSDKKHTPSTTFLQKISISTQIIKDAIRSVHHQRQANSSSSSNSSNHAPANNNNSNGNEYYAQQQHRKRHEENNCNSTSTSAIVYYEDNFNDLPWRCSFGTSENDGIWMNTNDTSGIIMASMVWIMILYSGYTVTILAQHNALHSIVAIIYCTLCFLALSSHAKTSLSDPGCIKQNAIPLEDDDGDNRTRLEFPMCSVCETYKPKYTHHCRICNRCISGMDHHCPWMNNCIGRGNFKFFILFLGYVWLASAYALVLFGLNYFLCHQGSNSDNNNDDDDDNNGGGKCTFPDMLVHLVRIMTILCMGAFWFTSNMIMNVFCGIMTGLGTIDRLKRDDELQKRMENDEDGVISVGRTRSGNHEMNSISPIPLIDIFGIEPYYTWFLPVDPVFEDYDRVFGYSDVARLMREKKMDG